MNQKKAKKSLNNFGFEGRVNILSASSSDSKVAATFYVEFTFEPALQEPFKVEMLKKGSDEKKEKVPTEAEINKAKAK